MCVADKAALLSQDCFNYQIKLSLLYLWRVVCNNSAGKMHYNSAGKMHHLKRLFMVITRSLHEVRKL
jgi:hypothetical protein